MWSDLATMIWSWRATPSLAVASRRQLKWRDVQHINDGDGDLYTCLEVTGDTSTIQTHYGRDDLVGRMLATLDGAGFAKVNLTVEMLTEVDKLHGGGIKATREQAIDITPAYVKAAQRLNERCGLGARIINCQGDVTELPYGDGSFDLAWSQNVTMEVADGLVCSPKCIGFWYRGALHLQPYGAGPSGRSLLSTALGSGCILQFPPHAGASSPMAG